MKSGLSLAVRRSCPTAAAASSSSAVILLRLVREAIFTIASHLIFVATLAIGPLSGALAQGNTAVGTADTKPKSALATGADSKAASSAGVNTNTPGATGTTVVPGSNSTVAGDKAATADAKTGGTNTGAGGGK
jgi:hypothetical protein